MRGGLVERAYWSCWAVAAALTGIVAGLMLGHALLLGRFVEWLLTSGSPDLGLQFPAFRATAGRAGLAAFYAVCGLEVVSVVAFLGAAVAAGRARALAVVAAAAGSLWVVAHYASGFGAVEARVVGATAEVPRDLALHFLRLNLPIHFFHAAMLVTALGALLAVPGAASRQKG